MTESPAIANAREPLPPQELARLVRLHFGDMVRFVVDLEQRALAVGGELHADGEELLLNAGSRREDLWGGNYLPGRGAERCIEYTSLINIRPSQGVECAGRRALVRELLRWRDLVAELYLSATDPERHEAALRALLLLTPAGAEQLRALRGDVPALPMPDAS